MRTSRTIPARGLGIAFAWLLVSLVAIPASAATRFTMPAPEVHTLDNGLHVAIFPNPRLPLVQTLLLIPAGSAADPVGQEGVAYLTAELLRHGTSSRSVATFAAELDRLGAAFASNATRDYSTVSNAFLARDLDAGFELMSDAVIQPLFDPTEMSKIEEQTLGFFGQLRRSPSNFAGEQVWASVFAGHPYARPVFGSPQSMRALNNDAVREFYGRYYRPDRATLAITGDVTPEQALAAAKEWFGRWEGKSSPTPDTPFTPPAKSTSGKLTIRLFDAPELREAEVRFGLSTPGRGHADETALALASSLIGGGPTSRLGRLAARGALGRDARSLQVFQKEAGVFTMGLTIGPDSVGLAVTQLADALRRFNTEPLDAAEFAAVRRVARNLLPVQFETGGAVITHWSVARFHGLPEGSYERQRQRLETITPDEVVAAARRWLDPERGTVIVLGPAAVLQPQLEKLGAVEVIRLDATTAEQPAPAPVKPSKENEVKARGIVKQALTAHGGATRLRGIKDSTVEADAVFLLGGRELRGKMVLIRKEPYKMRVTTSIEGISSEQSLNGRRAWSLTTSVPDAKPQDMDSLAVSGLRNGFETDLPHLLLGAADPAAQLVSLGRRTLDRREAEAVEVRRGAIVRVLYFDPRTTRLIAMDQREAQAAATSLSGRRIYGDLRSVGGILWPYAEERWIDGERIMTLTVTRIAVNAGVDDSIFDRPEPALPPPAR